MWIVFTYLNCRLTQCVYAIIVRDVLEEDTFEDGEFYAWNELRLHPLIMKSIYRLKFKEPTPIQKACIPAAAHQGKVIPNCM